MLATGDNSEMYEELGISEKLTGWAHIVSDMALHNELLDINPVNPPEVSAYNVEAEHWFTFGGFVKPGYHQIIIYDPLLDRGFCGDFVCKPNERAFVYPEYPIHLETFVDEQLPSVWKPWREDTPGDLTACFARESDDNGFTKTRLIEKVIKNEDAAAGIFKVFAENMDRIVLY